MSCAAATTQHPCQSGGACQCGGTCGGPKTPIQKAMAAEQTRWAQGTRFANGAGGISAATAALGQPISAMAMGLLESSARWHRNPAQFMAQHKHFNRPRTADHSAGTYLKMTAQAAKFSRNPAAFQKQHADFAARFGGGKNGGGCGGCAGKGGQAGSTTAMTSRAGLGGAQQFSSTTAMVAPGGLRLANTAQNQAYGFSANQNVQRAMTPQTAMRANVPAGLNQAFGMQANQNYGGPGAPQTARLAMAVGPTVVNRFASENQPISQVQAFQMVTPGWTQATVDAGLAADRVKWGGMGGVAGGAVVHAHSGGASGPSQPPVQCPVPVPPVYTCEGIAGWQQQQDAYGKAYGDYLWCSRYSKFENPFGAMALAQAVGRQTAAIHAAQAQPICLPRFTPYCIQCADGSTDWPCCPPGPPPCPSAPCPDGQACCGGKICCGGNTGCLAGPPDPNVPRCLLKQNSLNGLGIACAAGMILACPADATFPCECVPPPCPGCPECGVGAVCDWESCTCKPVPTGPCGDLNGCGPDEECFESPDTKIQACSKTSPCPILVPNPMLSVERWSTNGIVTPCTDPEVAFDRCCTKSGDLSQPKICAVPGTPILQNSSPDGLPPKYCYPI